MKTVLASACLIFLFLQPASAQSHSKGSGTIHGQPSSTINPTTSATLFLSGKVVISDGTPLTETAIIQSICHGQKRTETHTDSKGNFSFQFGDRVSTSAEAGFDAETTLDNQSGSRSAAPDAGDCELQASLAGFTSDTIQLSARLSGSENVDLGRIVLHRLDHVEGLTISATTAAAPNEARKALAKGQELEKKGQWADAEKLLEKAVSLYPKFAVAWFELGSVQLETKQFASARKSFEQSISADEKYINPYRSLMQISFHDQNWHEVIETSDKLLALNPINFPEAWFANGTGYLYLQNLVAAEKSARRGLAIDSEHHVPKLEYLLGVVLVQKSNFTEATQHIQAYLRMTTKPAEVAEAQKQLEEITRLSAAKTDSVQTK